MSMSKLVSMIHWRKHAIGLPVFIGSVIFFIFALYNYNSSLNSHKKALNALQQQQQANGYAERQRDVFNKYFLAYQNLQKRGVVGNTQRLQWLETLQDIGHRYGIPAIDFTLSNAVMAAELSEHYWHPELTFETTAMILKYTLLHEGDFYHLLDHLHRHGNGIFSAEKCELRREAQGLAKNFLEKLMGSCELKWYNLNDITKTWEAS